MPNPIITFLKGLGTDADERPEVKAILGIGIIIVSVVWLFTKGDVQGFLLIFAAGCGLLGIKTWEDRKIDESKGQ